MRFDTIFRFLLQGGVWGVEGQYIYNIMWAGQRGPMYYMTKTARYYNLQPGHCTYCDNTATVIN
jgi:hypothetical protein